MTIQNFNRIADMRKKNAQFTKDMEDRRTLALKNWKNGAGANKDKETYVLEQENDAMKITIKSQGQMIDAMLGMMEQVLNMQAGQDIKIVKAAQNKLRNSNAPTAEDITRQQVAAVGCDQLPDYLEGLKLMDPEIYSKNGRICYNTLGLSPMDIQYNEFDLEMIASLDQYDEPGFDLSDMAYIIKRWPSFQNGIKKHVGPSMTLKRFVTDYAKRRGIPVTFKKCGPKTTTNMEVK